MAKTIKTLAGANCVVTMTEAGTVTGNYNGKDIVLVTLDAPGQASFQAISTQTVISDDAAIVNPTSATAVFVGGASSSGGASTAAVVALIDDALYSETTDIPTPEGSDDCSYVYADIPAKYIPAGTLHSIVLQGAAAAGNGYASPAYLVIWQEQAPGTDDFQPLAVSSNAVTLEAGKACEWRFASPVMLNERIRFYLSDSPTLDSSFAWSSDRKLRSRVMLTSRWQDGHVFTPDKIDCLPEMIIRMDGAATKYAPREHAIDGQVHLSAEERGGLVALLARKDDILALLSATQELQDDEPVAVGGDVEDETTTLEEVEVVGDIEVSPPGGAYIPQPDDADVQI